jgi:hypothetical protein
MRFLEILFGIILFPLMLLLGIVLGIIKIYQIYDSSFWKTVKKEI